MYHRVIGGEIGLEPMKPEAGDLQSPVIAAIRLPHIQKKNRFRSANRASVDCWNFCSSNSALLQPTLHAWGRWSEMLDSNQQLVEY